MKLQELMVLEKNLTSENHLSVVNRMWHQYNKGNLNISYSLCRRILNKCKEYSPVNERIDDLMLEHNLSWMKMA